MFGYTVGEAIGKPMTILMPTDRHDEERVILERIRRRERVDHHEAVRRRFQRNNRLRWQFSLERLRWKFSLKRERSNMRRLTCCGAVACLAFAIPEPAAVAPLGVKPQAKAPLHLTDSQRQQVVRALNEKDTDDALPSGFHPAPGAAVPSQKRLPLYALPRPLIYYIPVLKQYYYAKLPKNVLIVDPMTRRVVDIIAR
jgi:hypothetical protein